MVDKKTILAKAYFYRWFGVRTFSAKSQFYIMELQLNAKIIKILNMSVMCQILMMMNTV
jgi:hypothetical protein